MSKIIRFFFFSILFCFGMVSAFAQQSGSFSWILGLQNERTGDLVSFSAPVKSSTGERFRLVINPVVNCYCYIVIESSDGNEAGIIYTGSLKGGGIWHSTVIELTPPKGSESIFVVVSRSEQKDLYQRITAFKSNPGPTQKRAMMNEIFLIRNKVSQYREVPPAPLLMGGTIRGDQEKNQGLVYSGLDTYVKVISIEH